MNLDNLIVILASVVIVQRMPNQYKKIYLGAASDQLCRSIFSGWNLIFFSYHRTTNKRNSCTVLEKTCVALIQFSFPFTVNGGYTEWNNWSPCSVSCGKGIKTRQRFCTNPEPAYGGVGCGHLGSAEESLQCYDVNCPSKCYCCWLTAVVYMVQPVLRRNDSFNSGKVILILFKTYTCHLSKQPPPPYITRHLNLPEEGGKEGVGETFMLSEAFFFCQLTACTARGRSGQRARSHADTGFRLENEPAQVRNHSMEGETALTLETRKICALVKLYNARVSVVLVRSKCRPKCKAIGGHSEQTSSL